MSSGLSDKSKTLESRLRGVEEELATSDARCRALQQDREREEVRLQGELIKAQTQLEQAREALDCELLKAVEHAKLATTLEKRVSALSADLEGEKTHAKDLLQKSNRCVHMYMYLPVCVCVLVCVCARV
jgi:hypothetical protein